MWWWFVFSKFLLSANYLPWTNITYLLKANWSVETIYYSYDSKLLIQYDEKDILNIVCISALYLIYKEAFMPDCLQLSYAKWYVLNNLTRQVVIAELCGAFYGKQLWKLVALHMSGLWFVRTITGFHLTWYYCMYVSRCA